MSKNTLRGLKLNAAKVSSYSYNVHVLRTYTWIYAEYLQNTLCKQARSYAITYLEKPV